LTTGPYTLSLQYQDPAFLGVNREAVLIGYGQTLSADINDETFLHFYYFDGRQGDQVSIEVDTVESFNDLALDPVLYLYALSSTNDFILLAANDDSPLGGTYDPYLEYTLPRTGGYVIAVTRYVETAAPPTSGRFEVTLRLQNPSR
jgi:hypothetical protein